MPVVRIEDFVNRPMEQRNAIVGCVFTQLREIFGVTDAELQSRYIHISGVGNRPPGGCESYLHVEVSLFAGRKPATKKRFYQTVVSALAGQFSIPPKSILILLNEQPRHNWGLQGGRIGTEIDVGYEIAV
jgi:phenylpyruvate tautomerase PptA (4-oxalocrotonate tautomerase family)